LQNAAQDPIEEPPLPSNPPPLLIQEEFTKKLREKRYTYSKDVYKTLAPAKLRFLERRARRELCWKDAQEQLRRAINEEFLATYARP